MSDELEQAAQTAAEHAAAAAMAEGGGPVRARRSRPAALRTDVPEGLCANCETTLEGPVCHQCGQVADQYHRPVRGLISELIEGVFALDGRVARTLPALLLWPGKITRAYLKGQRARFMPPFRLYIIASLVFFILAPALDQNWASDFEDGWNLYSPTEAETASFMETAERQMAQAVESGEMTQQEADRTRESFERLSRLIEPPSSPERTAQAEGAASASEAPAAEQPTETDASADGLDVDVDTDGIRWGGGSTPDELRQRFAPEDFGQPAPDTIWPLPVRRYLGERFARVAEDPEGWLVAAFDWIPRIMFAMVPIYALLLGLVYVWRRGFFLYDHLIVSMHFHAALFLAMSISMKASVLIGGGWATFIMIVYSNLYLYKLHRVVYQRGRFASMVRTLVLDSVYSLFLLLGFLSVLLLGAIAG